MRTRLACTKCPCHPRRYRYLPISRPSLRPPALTRLPQVLHERNFPYSDLVMLASSRSAGKKYTFEGVEYTVQELTEKRWVGWWVLNCVLLCLLCIFSGWAGGGRRGGPHICSPAFVTLSSLLCCSFDGLDIALFSAGGSISKKFAPIASSVGCTVVDNSSCFRMTVGRKAASGGVVCSAKCAGQAQGWRCPAPYRAACVGPHIAYCCPSPSAPFASFRRRACPWWCLRSTPRCAACLVPLPAGGLPACKAAGVLVAAFLLEGLLAARLRPTQSLSPSLPSTLLHPPLLYIPHPVQAMAGMKYGKGGIVANPNCSTIIALMGVTPLHRVGE